MKCFSSKWKNVHNSSKMVHNDIKMVHNLAEMVHYIPKMVHNFNRNPKNHPKIIVITLLDKSISSLMIPPKMVHSAETHS